MHLIRIATAMFLLWSTAAVVLSIGAFTLMARHQLDRDREPAAMAMATPQAPERLRPGGVPASARLVRSDTTFGDVSATAPQADGAPHIFYALTCEKRLLIIATTRETIYAELDCGQYWLIHEVVRPYLAQPVRVYIAGEPPAMLVVEAAAAGAARFNVDAVWLDQRER